MVMQGVPGFLHIDCDWRTGDCTFYSFPYLFSGFDMNDAYFYDALLCKLYCYIYLALNIGFVLLCCKRLRSSRARVNASTISKLGFTEIKKFHSRYLRTIP